VTGFEYSGEHLTEQTYTITLESADDITTPIQVTLDPLNKGSNLVLSNSDLTVTSTNGFGGWENVKSTVYKTTGKWYWEVTLDVEDNGTWFMVSIAHLNHPTNDDFVGNAPNDTGWGYWDNTTVNRFYWNTFFQGLPGYMGFSVGDVVRVRIDIEALEIYMAINAGVWALAPYPLSSTAGGFTPSLDLHPEVGVQATINYGAIPFVYSVPSGYKAFNVKE
jgi:hypothetical protein